MDEMKTIFLLLLIFCLTAEATEYRNDWIKPSSIEVKNETTFYKIEGYVFFKKEKVYDVRSKKFGGNFYISSNKEKAENLTPLSVGSFENISKFLNKKVVITGSVLSLKTGHFINPVKIETP